MKLIINILNFIMLVILLCLFSSLKINEDIFRKQDAILNSIDTLKSETDLLVGLSNTIIVNFGLSKDLQEELIQTMRAEIKAFNEAGK